jgi:Tol biopolymer transport system component
MQTGESHSLPIPDGYHIRTIEWFPDENRLLLTSDEDARFPGLWIISVSGGPPHVLDDKAHEAAISPDGRLIVCTRSGYREIWLMNAQGGQRHRIMTAPGDDLVGRRPVFFPNGKRILFGRLHPTNGPDVGTIESSNLEGKEVHLAFAVEDVGIISNCLLVLADGRVIYPQQEGVHVGLRFPGTNGHNLWEARIDLQTGEPKSRPRQITKSAGFGGIGELSASTDGKRLAVLQGLDQSDVYIGDVVQNGTRLENPRRLTLNETNDLLGAWTPDGKAILFTSDRDNPNGTFDIFKQALDQREAEPVVLGPEAKRFAAVSPDGAWVYYLTLPSPWHPGDIVKLMRAPMAGGRPGLVVGGRPVVAVSCSRPSADRCIVTEYDRKQFTFYDLDPSHGEGRELLRLSNPGEADTLTRFFETLAFLTTCRITPDGSFVACARVDKDPVTFRFLPLGDGQERDVTVKGAVYLSDDFDFAPDGRGIYAQGATAEGRQDIYISPEGHVHTLRRASRMGWRVSPDGQHLAFEKNNESYNVWLIENF